jgi:hypothetical protein
MEENAHFPEGESEEIARHGHTTSTMLQEVVSFPPRCGQVLTLD